MKTCVFITGIAALFLATGTAARAAETFDWGKYCGDRNNCDPSDSEDNKWQPPSAAELRACTKNGKLDYNCLRKSEHLRKSEPSEPTSRTHHFERAASLRRSCSCTV